MSRLKLVAQKKKQRNILKEGGSFMAGRDIDLKQIVDTILRKEMDLLRAIG